MRPYFRESLNQLDRDGYSFLKAVFSVAEMQSLTNRLATALDTGRDHSILRSRGKAYGCRNLLAAFPEVIQFASSRVLHEFSLEVLGTDAGIVRILFFDKPPDRSWSLPWHQDRTIAVKRNDQKSEFFQKPTIKAGVPHVEAPAALLEKMLTLRIHLDPMTADNGPLCVLPGSHREANGPPAAQPQELHAEIGDVLAMRPLLSHSSTLSQPNSTSHRRVIHIELAGQPELADGHEWYSFIPLACRPTA